MCLMQLKKIYGEDDSQELGDNSYYFVVGVAVTAVSVSFLKLQGTCQVC